ncbi:hypothetical protein [Clostridium sp. DJ247]|uniref:hypothetical protein n=1 Tax=Clostridium sp. DJ247 TaxID=2726188 RepID=UPI0016244323|nr:hypothetical protein [Clostridium sp. DJ247]MBC2579837.1 hypothetical protein [Clostridium sp. DJ247]
MSKRFLSFIVIICTIFCVLIMLFSDRITLKKEANSDKIQVIDNTKPIKGDSKPNKDIISENNNMQKENESKTNKINSYVDTDEYKRFKMGKLQQEIKKDKDDFFNKSKVEDNSKYDKGNSNDNLDKGNKKANSSESKKELSGNKDNTSNSVKEGMPVFKISKYKVKDSLTFTDKEKLLVIASKLSAVDYEKINEYLQKGSDEDIKNTIKLLRERLSDKDYEKVREVAGKFINMDVVEQW